MNIMEDFDIDNSDEGRISIMHGIKTWTSKGKMTKRESTIEK